MQRCMPHNAISLKVYRLDLFKCCYHFLPEPFRDLLPFPLILVEVLYHSKQLTTTPSAFARISCISSTYLSIPSFFSVSSGMVLQWMWILPDMASSRFHGLSGYDGWCMFPFYLLEVINYHIIRMQGSLFPWTSLSSGLLLGPRNTSWYQR